jgi:hypothetical protein
MRIGIWSPSRMGLTSRSLADHHLALDSAGRADHREEVLDNDWLPAHGLAEFRRCNLFEDSAKLLAADDRPEPGCCAYCPPAPPRLRDACAKFAPDSSRSLAGDDMRRRSAKHSPLTGSCYDRRARPRPHRSSENLISPGVMVEWWPEAGVLIGAKMGRRTHQIRALSAGIRGPRCRCRAPSFLPRMRPM